MGADADRTEQPPYNLLARGVEYSLLPRRRRYGSGVLTWIPLAWGFLSGTYRKGADIDLDAGRPTLNRGRFDPTDPANSSPRSPPNWVSACPRWRSRSRSPTRP